MDYYDDYGDDLGPGDKLKGLGSGLHPSIRSALIIWVALFVIAMLNSFTGGSSILFCYGAQVLVYLGNGVLSGYFALSSGYRSSELAKVGALAGLIGWILPAVFYLIFGLVLGLVAAPIGIFGIALWILCGPVDLAIQVICGLIGAILYGRFGGGGMEEDDYESYY